MSGEPRAARPSMPGYGVADADGGRGLLPWSWAEERLLASHDYWLASVWPDGRPHVMPVWAVWLDGALWFSSSARSRKTRNLTADPRCVLTTDNALEPVVLEGVAARVTADNEIAPFAAALDGKYATAYGADFFVANATFRVAPATVFSLDEEDFTGTPTRWTFT